MTQAMTGGHLVVRMLTSLGVRHVFGVPGGQTLAITEAIRQSMDIDFITCRHEGAAAVMADAYGRLTGVPGVCLATTGPGATNLMTGVGGALRDSSPVIVLTCNNNGENIGKDDAQNADHVQLFRPLTKYSRLVAHGTSIRQAMQEAFVNAVSGTPGPVHLDFARDTIERPLSGEPPAIPEVHPLRSWVAQRPAPDPVILSQAAELMLKARRPVLWLGNGCNRSGAGEAALSLAEALQAPVITTFNGIGSVPTTHPLVFGPLSRMGTELSTRVVGEADLVIAVGNSLNAISTSRWRLELPRIIQIDIEPTMIGRYYGEQTLGVVADARIALQELQRAAVGRPAKAMGTRGDWIARLQDFRQDWQRRAALEADSADGAAGLSPAEVVRRLRQVAPDSTLLIPDAGNPGVWSYLWDIRQPGTYIKPVGFGNMGFALPAAIAASVIDPARPVLALIGDGSLGMTMGELETLARVGGRVCAVVLNDDGYGNIRQEQAVVYGEGHSIGVDFGSADYAQVARGMGLAAERVDDLDVLAKKVGEALVGDSPTVLEILLDPTVSAWTFPVFRPYKAEQD